MIRGECVHASDLATFRGYERIVCECRTRGSASEIELSDRSLSEVALFKVPLIRLSACVTVTPRRPFGILAID